MLRSHSETYKWLGLTGVVLAGGLILAAYSSAVVVPPGHTGVLSVFGKVDDGTFPSGFHLVMPWCGVHMMSIRTQELKETMTVPTKEGLTVTVDASLLFKLDESHAPSVFTGIGPEYVSIIVAPQFRSAVRGVTVAFEAKDLYTTGRMKIEKQIEDELKGKLSDRGILCEQLLLRRIELPDTVQRAIEEKMTADQRSQAMEFEIARTKKDAERRLAEAEGIAASQKLIQTTLSENYIRYLWVQALETAAKNRTTVIYVPTGRDGLPLMAPLKDPDRVADVNPVADPKPAGKPEARRVPLRNPGNPGVDVGNLSPVEEPAPEGRPRK